MLDARSNYLRKQMDIFFPTSIFSRDPWNSSKEMKPSWKGCRILVFTTEIYIVPVRAFFPSLRRLWLSTNVTWSKSVSSSILSAMERSWSEVTLAPTIMVSTASNSWSSFHSVLCWTSAPLWICSRHHRDHTWRRQTWTFPFLIGAFWFRTLSGPFWPAGTGQAVSKSLENPPI